MTRTTLILPLHPLPLPLFLLLLLLLCCTVQRARAVRFTDVTRRVGLRQFGRTKKFGGPAIADIDGDGWPDIVLGHHDSRRVDIYLNDGGRSFSHVSNFVYRQDLHGITVYHPTPRARGMSVVMHIGGNYGKHPSPPDVYYMDQSREIRHVQRLQYSRGRGRSSVRVANNVLVFNRHAFFAYAVRSRDYMAFQGRVHGMRNVPNSFAAAVDVDGDGAMEVVSYPNLMVHRVYRRDGKVTLVNARYMLPQHLRGVPGVTAVAELDFDNDGYMDVVVTRSTTGDLRWLRGSIGTEPRDILLRNVRGVYYEDVTISARLNAVGGESRGVTVGDFNNDGWVDVLVVRYKGADKLLINEGGRRFHTHLLYTKAGDARVRGDHAVAFDYDRDGRLDVAFSQGDWFEARLGGTLKLWRNVSAGRGRRWLLVRVGSSRKGRATSLHALATVSIRRFGKVVRFVRRVGSPGTCVAQSNVELLHFGLGHWKWAVNVSVKWTDGSTQYWTRVRTNQMIVMGNI